MFVQKYGDDEELQKYLNSDNYEEIKEILNPKNFNLVVTPKEIDELTNDMALLISKGINNAL